MTIVPPPKCAVRKESRRVHGAKSRDIHVTIALHEELDDHTDLEDLHRQKKMARNQNGHILPRP